jgi:4-diphosphocytidyl-2C-methyl-D-erythritol kinase
MSSSDVYSKLASDKSFHSVINTNNITEFFDKKIFSQNVIFNDLQPYAFKLNKKLKLSYEALKLNYKNVILSGSGGSFVLINN